MLVFVICVSFSILVGCAIYVVSRVMTLREMQNMTARPEQKAPRKPSQRQLFPKDLTAQ